MDVVWSRRAFCNIWKACKTWNSNFHIVFEFEIKSLHCQYSHPSLGMWLISLRIPACPSINLYAIWVYDQHISINLSLHSYCFPGLMHSSMEVINGPWFCVKTVEIYESAVVWVMNALPLLCALPFCGSSLHVIGKNDYNQY